MFKRTLLCALTLVITLFISGPGYAANDQDDSLGHDSISPQTKMEIIKTMEELTKISLEKLNPQNSSKLSSNAEGTLRKKLSSLGVRELTPIEVQEKISKNLVTPNVSVPPSNSNVRWYELRYTHTRSGKTYDIQELYAQAVGYNTNLYSSNNTLYLINGTKTQVNVGQALINVYANKLIGVIASLNPITNILPYELFVKIPDGSSTISMNSDFISYRLLSTACFSYVKDSGKSDDYLTMTYAYALAVRRMIEPEPVFGDMKNNWDFKRFLLRGLPKASFEVGWLSLAHNLLKKAAADAKNQGAKRSVLA
ncbi:hypothetical protein POTG_04236 [Paenibacillus sp. oral taxon 786 str. D14]|uniref:transposase n=1 Tax=Paenibacillus sp. FSL K6-2441 TaxID=2954679 RepID=UPI0001AFD5DC|nr:transposase [Paenibacillus sp. oral taxon 786]EES71154.1 hypothetical protein POTG_04236 [Paenibacillus sp. oral taxon 786 str. D14]